MTSAIAYAALHQPHPSLLVQRRATLLADAAAARQVRVARAVARARARG
jgi:hypothetical protein